MTDWIANGESGASVRAKLNAEFHSVSVALTANQINHLFSSPQTILVAPGAGKAIIPLFVEFYNHVGTVPTGSGAGEAGNVILSSGVNGIAVAGDEGVFEAPASSFLVSPTFLGAYANFPITGASSPPGVSVQVQPYAAITNKSLVISNSVDDYINYGAIATSSITSGHAGSGYAVGDTGTVEGSYAPFDRAKAAYVIDSVGGGAVLTYHLTIASSGYKTGITGNATATGGAQPGSGTGFQIDVNSVTPGDGSGLITLTYKIVTLP